MCVIRSLTVLLAVCWFIGLVGCGDDHGHSDHGHKDHGHKDHGHKDHAHKHEAKYGGALVGLGDHKAHLEFVIDADQKKFFMYIWDGEVEHPIRIKAENVAVKIKDGPTLTLDAQANENTGEKVGDSSTFACDLADLKGMTKFDAELPDITIRDETHKDVHFNYPRGAEE